MKEKDAIYLSLGMKLPVKSADLYAKIVVAHHCSGNGNRTDWPMSAGALDFAGPLDAVTFSRMPRLTSGTRHSLSPATPNTTEGGHPSLQNGFRQ